MKTRLVLLPSLLVLLSCSSDPLRTSDGQCIENRPACQMGQKVVCDGTNNGCKTCRCAVDESDPLMPKRVAPTPGYQPKDMSGRPLFPPPPPRTGQ